MIEREICKWISKREVSCKFDQFYCLKHFFGNLFLILSFINNIVFLNKNLWTWNYEMKSLIILECFKSIQFRNILVNFLLPSWKCWMYKKNDYDLNLMLLHLKIIYALKPPKLWSLNIKIYAETLFYYFCFFTNKYKYFYVSWE